MNWTSSLILLLFLISIEANAQHSDTDLRKKVVHDVMDGYNNQDFKAMQKPWIGLAKLAVTPKKLRAEFEPFFKKFGLAAIDTITYSSKYEYVAQLKMEKRPKERIYFQFIFSDKGKIEGFGFTHPPLIYRKSQVGKIADSSGFNRNLDSLIAQKYLKKAPNSLNGSILVLDQGVPIFKKHIGFSNFEHKTPINDSTRFELASCSKQFTAWAILILVRQAKLTLTDSLQTFFPDFPYHKITVEHLLTHTSGLPDYELLLAKKWDKSRFATNSDVLKLLTQQNPKVLFQPNEQFQYSNTGYVLLASIIEKVSGVSFGEFLQKEVFTPLKMNDSRVWNTRRAGKEMLENGALGYVFDSEKKRYILPDSNPIYQQVIYQDAITGDGTVNSSCRDLILWEKECLHPTLIRREEFEKATSPYQLKNGTKTNYGFGFFLSGGGHSERLFYHTGGWPGYLCIIMNFPNLKKQVVILTNNSFDPILKLADDIAARLLEGT